MNVPKGKKQKGNSPVTDTSEQSLFLINSRDHHRHNYIEGKGEFIKIIY